MKGELGPGTLTIDPDWPCPVRLTLTVPWWAYEAMAMGVPFTIAIPGEDASDDQQ